MLIEVCRHIKCLIYHKIKDALTGQYQLKENQLVEFTAEIMEKINGRMKTDEEHCYEKIKSFVGENEKMNLQYTQAYIKESMKDFEEIMDAELDGF
jgi:hypothetical protein